MYPIYNHMKNFLNQFLSICTHETEFPLENILMNLLYEFPHPGMNTLVVSKFWKHLDDDFFLKYHDPFEYEIRGIQNYWDLRNYKNKGNHFLLDIEILNILTYHMKVKKENGGYGKLPTQYRPDLDFDRIPPTWLINCVSLSK